MDFPFDKVNQSLSSSETRSFLSFWESVALTLAVLLADLALTLATKSFSWTKSSLKMLYYCLGKPYQGSIFNDQGLDILILYLNQKIKQYFQSIIHNHQTIMTDIKKVNEIYEKSRLAKSANLSNLEQQVGVALIQAINHLDGESKKVASIIHINKALEINIQKDKSFVLLYVSYRSNKVLLTPLYKKLVTQLEKKLKKTVLVLSTRNIQSRWVKQNRTQKRANSRTLSAVYSAILDELLLPGVIIGSRTRVRLDGSSFTRITLDKNEQHFVEDRVEAIRAAYRHLTHRQIEIDFQKEATYFTLKKGEKK